VPPKLSYFVVLVALAIIGLAMVRWLNPRMRLLGGAAVLMAVAIFVASDGCLSNRRARTLGVVAPHRNPPRTPSSPDGIKRVPAPAQQP
jgi:hypothetical protein